MTYLSVSDEESGECPAGFVGTNICCFQRDVWKFSNLICDNKREYCNKKLQHFPDVFVETKLGVFKLTSGLVVSTNKAGKGCFLFLYLNLTG